MAVEGKKLAVVVPAYGAETTISGVIEAMPDYVDWVIVVNDASPDGLASVVSAMEDPRVVLLTHEKNTGVGGAMVTGFKKALDLGADLVAKVDADGQMDPQYLDRFCRAAVVHGCDYVKANRFGHIQALPQMPKTRLWGNLGLTFLTKFASGYWNVFDPQNGYVLITRSMLSRLDLDRIDPTYFFENSMLINLNIMRATIGEIYLPAQYGDEPSHLQVSKILKLFPPKLFKGLCYRIFQKYIFRSTSPFAILFFFGMLLMLWGGLFGGFHWVRSSATGVVTTTGTVVLALLPLLLGFASVLQAFVLDVTDAGPCKLFEYDEESLLPAGTGKGKGDACES